MAPENSRHVLLCGASSVQPHGWVAPGAEGELSPSVTRQDRPFPKEPERQSLEVASSAPPLVPLPQRFGSGLKLGLSQDVFQQEPCMTGGLSMPRVKLSSSLAEGKDKTSTAKTPSNPEH